MTNRSRERRSRYLLAVPLMLLGSVVLLVQTGSAADTTTPPLGPITPPAPTVTESPTLDKVTIVPTVAAPVIELSHYEMLTDSRVVLTVSGFRSQLVNATVCGNAARRGSGDCNVRGTQPIVLNADGTPTKAELVISVPPMPCPCIVRVANTSSDEVAVAPITIIGHPNAEVVGAIDFSEAIDATITPERVSGGAGRWLKSSLGGATEYQVTVRIKNRSTEPVVISGIDGWAGRGEQDIKLELELDPPGRVDPGATWERVVIAKLPAPVYGTSTWRLDLSAEGLPTFVVTERTSHLPGLLILLLIVLAFDLLVLVGRVVVRFQARRNQAQVVNTTGYTPGHEYEGEPVLEYSN